MITSGRSSRGQYSQPKVLKLSGNVDPRLVKRLVPVIELVELSHGPVVSAPRQLLTS